MVGRGEAWFWRIIGICAMSVCSLNVLLLLNGQLYVDKRGELYAIQQQAVARSKSPVSTVPSVNDDYVGKLSVTPPTTQQTTTTTRPVHAQPSKLVTANSYVGQKHETKSEQEKTILAALKKPLWLTSNGIERKPFMEASKIRILGSTVKKKPFLVIGVPTVPRKKAYYLIDTLRGLVNGLSETERSEVLIIVFIATTDTEFVTKVKREVSEELKEAVALNMIHVIVAEKEFYPKLDNLIPLYGDKPDRVRWRSKQSLDYSFLYYYAAKLGHYFMQLEDDVLTEKGYLKRIKTFITLKGEDWSNLEFGSRGFIGMLYRGEHLLPLARFCRVYFWTMPVDWLFRVFNEIFLHGNSARNALKPPLFKHIGTFSSLDGQVRKLEDFKKSSAKAEVIPKKYTDADNPPALLTTTIKGNVGGHSIDKAYLKDGYFWGKNIELDDTITITLESAVALKKFAIVSGSALYPADTLESGEVWITADNSCSDYGYKVAEFTEKTSIEVDLSGVTVNIKCIQLRLTSVNKDDHGRTRWLIINEMRVWVKKK